jgi:hypothetical protein
MTASFDRRPRDACPVTNVTPLELALIPAGTALVGVALAMAGNAYLDRQRERRAAKGQRDRALAELLTATVDLISGVQMIRAAYYQRYASLFRNARIGATLIAAAGLAMTGGDKLTWGPLRDWHSLSPGLDRLLAADRELDEKQRVVALDLATIVAPRTVRFYAAVAVLTLGPDEKIADAVRALAPAVGALTEVIAANQKKYDQARAHAEQALGKFRAVADQRRR